MADDVLERDNEKLGKTLVSQIRWALSAETTNRNKVILTALILHSDRYDLDSWVSLKKLSQVTGIHESGISRGLAKLESDGLISKGRYWKKNVYQLKCNEDVITC